VNIFLDELEVVIKDAKDGVVKGLRVLDETEKKKKRSVTEAMTEGPKAGKTVWLSRNDPSVLMTLIPTPAKNSILAQPVAMRPQLLVSYLDTQLGRLTVLQQEAICSQSNQTDMLEKMMEILASQGGLQALTFSD